MDFKLSKLQMMLKFLKLFVFRVVKRRWFLPGIPEITVNTLYKKLNNEDSVLIIDTREKTEYDGAEGAYRTTGHIPNSKSIPIMQLTSKLDDINEFKYREVVTLCPGGGMSLIAADILKKAGFMYVMSLQGGIWAWEKKGYPTIKTKDTSTSNEDNIFIKNQKYNGKIHKSVDAKGFGCPIPVLYSRKGIKAIEKGQVLEILTTDPASLRDIPSWAIATGQKMLISEERKNHKDYHFLIQKESCSD